MANLVSNILNNGGDIWPLIIPSEHTNGTGLCNPSILNDNGKLLINLRHVQYDFYHTFGKYESRYGPLLYMHPDSDRTLRTVNYLMEWDQYIQLYNKVDTTLLDKPPVWEFIGLEDARLVRWDDKLYLTGVRRDTTTNGEGRMELSLIEDCKEIERTRIQPPIETYCEKNWMPITDMPFHYVKWCNPTEIVKVEGDKAQTIFTGDTLNLRYDLRGGSNVINIGDGYHMAIVHRTQFWRNEQDNKQSIYTHHIMVWDKDWKVDRISREFNFMGGDIEFCVGLEQKDNDFYITFGFEDAAAYLVKVKKDWLINWIYV